MAFEHIVKNIYIGEYIEQTFIPVDAATTIAKSWYNIKQVILEAGYNTSTAGNFSLKIYKTSWGKDIWMRLFQWSSWKWSNDYGYLFKDNPSFSQFLNFNSSWTTSSKWFCRVTFLPTSWILQVGQTKDNRIYEGTFTYNSDCQSTITETFNSPTAICWLYGSTGNAIGQKVTVEYEPSI